MKDASKKKNKSAKTNCLSANFGDRMTECENKEIGKTSENESLK